MRKLEMVVSLAATLALAAPLAAQGRSGNVPPGQRPPRGMCRVWIDGVPPGRQPRATDCATAERSVPRNGRVIYGEGTYAGRYGQYNPNVRYPSGYGYPNGYPNGTGNANNYPERARRAQEQRTGQYGRYGQYGQYPNAQYPNGTYGQYPDYPNRRGEARRGDDDDDNRGYDRGSYDRSNQNYNRGDDDDHDGRGRGKGHGKGHGRGHDHDD